MTRDYLRETVRNVANNKRLHILRGFDLKITNLFDLSSDTPVEPALRHSKCVNNLSFYDYIV